MSWLSKGTKSVASALPGVVHALSGGASDLLGFGGKSGPTNPYGAPNLAYLNDTSKLDYLKDPSMYKSLLDTSKYDFLKTPSAAAPSAAGLDAIPGQLKTFANTYKAPGYGKSDSLYQSLIDSTSGPSSVDAVRNQLNTEQLDQLMKGLNIDTKNTVGSLKSDFADRGLGGPGMLSDIEANALTQAYGDSNRTAAEARTKLGQSQLDLLKNRETQNIAARTAAAGAAGGQDTVANQIAASGAQGDVNNFDNSLLETAKAKIAAEDAAAGRTNQNALTYAGLLESGTKGYTDALQGGNDLFAQLLNQRDLGAAGINSTNYNTGVGQQYQYTKPGILETLLGNTKINLGMGGGG